MPLSSSRARDRCSWRCVSERWAVVHLRPRRSAISDARMGRSATASRISMARATPCSEEYGRAIALPLPAVASRFTSTPRAPRADLTAGPDRTSMRRSGVADRSAGPPSMPDRLLAPLADPPRDRCALRFPGVELDYLQLRSAAAAIAHEVAGARRVAVWCEPRAETCVAVVGALIAGVPAALVNPR